MTPRRSLLATPGRPQVLLLWVPAQVAIICYCLFAFGVFSDDRGPCASLDDLRCFPQAADGTADCRRAGPSPPVYGAIPGQQLSRCPACRVRPAPMHGNNCVGFFCCFFHCRNWAYDCQSSTARIVLTSLISGLALATLVRR